jgi:hypothetical protein
VMPISFRLGLSNSGNMSGLIRLLENTTACFVATSCGNPAPLKKLTQYAATRWNYRL